MHIYHKKEEFTRIRDEYCFEYNTLQYRLIKIKMFTNEKIIDEYFGLLDVDKISDIKSNSQENLKYLFELFEENEDEDSIKLFIELNINLED